MWRWVVVVTAALALAGCATNLRWVRAGATEADFEADKLRCQYEAQLATANAPTGYGLGGAAASGIATGIQQVQLATLCMRTKGWQQVAAN